MALALPGWRQSRLSGVYNYFALITSQRFSGRSAASANSRTQAEAVAVAMNAVQRWVRWAVPATPDERAAALWSFAYFFTLLAGYCVLRPLRDQMGIAVIESPNTMRWSLDWF